MIVTVEPGLYMPSDDCVPEKCVLLRLSVCLCECCVLCVRVRCV